MRMKRLISWTDSRSWRSCKDSQWHGIQYQSQYSYLIDAHATIGLEIHFTLFTCKAVQKMKAGKNVMLTTALGEEDNAQLISKWKKNKLFHISQSKDKTFSLYQPITSFNMWFAWQAFRSVSWEAYCNGKTTGKSCSSTRESMRIKAKESQTRKGRMNKRSKRRASPNLHWEADYYIGISNRTGARMAKEFLQGREWKVISGNGRKTVQWKEIRLRLQESVVRN